jgi:hypothetical protein
MNIKFGSSIFSKERGILVYLDRGHIFFTSLAHRTSSDVQQLSIQNLFHLSVVAQNTYLCFFIDRLSPSINVCLPKNIRRLSQINLISLLNCGTNRKFINYTLWSFYFDNFFIFQRQRMWLHGWFRCTHKYMKQECLQCGIFLFISNNFRHFPYTNFNLSLRTRLHKIFLICRCKP